ncbi:uncharacterized protein LOC114741139 [Neltuma alba]|uniref:uncharacterized protein LOC114741139 n=1 Tax=Neltuma alba TaxID=207710 RepID=UPI0010A42061|nr:uncharacterized protein LOC114741139 [Prosopis alba]
MAENLDDGEFWLPPQILADDDLVMEKHGCFGKPKNNDAEPFQTLFPSEFPYGYVSRGVPSNFSSPVESVVGSSETESDEEEHMVALTRRMAYSTLDLESEFGPGLDKSKGMFVSGSPKSTLCTFGSECGCRKGSSSHGSPTSAYQVSSPGATWDLLRAAVGEVEKMKMNEAGYDFNHQRGLLGPPSRKPSPVNLPVKNFNPDVGFYNQTGLSHQQLQIAQFQMLRQQQMAKVASESVLNQQRQSKQAFSNREVRSSEVVGGGRNTGRPVGLSSSVWPSLLPAKQQQIGSGMRAVFLENPAGKRESAGTGVFLPRRVDNPAESRRKPACSTVLVPARVMQALNLKFDEVIGGQPPYQARFNGCSPMDSDAHVPKVRNNHNLPQQSGYLRPQQRSASNEIRLPPEWSY